MYYFDEDRSIIVLNEYKVRYDSYVINTEGVIILEEPLQILFDELAEHGLNWNKRVLVAAGVSEPMAILDLAEWLAHHRKATWQEMMREKVRLIEKYQL